MSSLHHPLTAVAWIAAEVQEEIPDRGRSFFFRCLETAELHYIALNLFVEGFGSTPFRIALGDKLKEDQRLFSQQLSAVTCPEPELWFDPKARTLTAAIKHIHDLAEKWGPGYLSDWRQAQVDARRFGYYDHAHELLAFLRKYEEKHGPLGASFSGHCPQNC